MQRRSSRYWWAALCALYCGGAAAERPPPGTEREAPVANGPPAGERPASNNENAPSRLAITMEDASAIVRQTYGGRVVHRETLSDKRGYRIRVDVKGRVKTVFVNRSGRAREQPPRQRDAPADR